jgi:hypothetical protein
MSDVPIRGGVSPGCRASQLKCIKLLFDHTWQCSIAVVT